MSHPLIGALRPCAALGSGARAAAKRRALVLDPRGHPHTYPFSILSSWKLPQELRAAEALPQRNESKRIEFGRPTLTRVQWHGRAGAGRTRPGASSGRRVRDR